MKTKIKKTILSFAIILSLFSCSKDDEPTPEPAKTYDIKGYYQGTLGIGTLETGTSIVMIIEENGKATFINNAKLSGSTSDEIGYGTYTISGNQITITADLGTVLTFTGVFETTSGKLTGNWTNGSDASGKFKINKNITGKDNISGYWKGTYTLNSDVNNFVMISETDGTCTFGDLRTSFTGVSNTFIGYGSFTLNNNQFYTSIKYGLGTAPFAVNESATFDNANGKLINGTWLYTGNGTTGTWTMTKMYY